MALRGKEVDACDGVNGGGKQRGEWTSGMTPKLCS